ncbi:MAG: DUF6777 domain-containing protein, partial [Pseudonocardiaceae bacterium]
MLQRTESGFELVGRPEGIERLGGIDFDEAVFDHVRQALGPGPDTRVTNHGYRDGKATDRQAVLQAGTAVLVDEKGRPRVKCGCG